jgi:hypothetical protein
MHPPNDKNTLQASTLRAISPAEFRIVLRDQNEAGSGISRGICGKTGILIFKHFNSINN